MDWVYEEAMMDEQLSMYTNVRNMRYVGIIVEQWRWQKRQNIKRRKTRVKTFKNKSKKRNMQQQLHKSTPRQVERRKEATKFRRTEERVERESSIYIASGYYLILFFSSSSSQSLFLSISAACSPSFVALLLCIGHSWWRQSAWIIWILYFISNISFLRQHVDRCAAPHQSRAKPCPNNFSIRFRFWCIRITLWALLLLFKLAFILFYESSAWFSATPRCATMPNQRIQIYQFCIQIFLHFSVLLFLFSLPFVFQSTFENGNIFGCYLYYFLFICSSPMERLSVLCGHFMALFYHRFNINSSDKPTEGIKLWKKINLESINTIILFIVWVWKWIPFRVQVELTEIRHPCWLADVWRSAGTRSVCKRFIIFATLRSSRFSRMRISICGLRHLWLGPQRNSPCSQFIGSETRTKSRVNQFVRKFEIGCGIPASARKRRVC